MKEDETSVREEQRAKSEGEERASAELPLPSEKDGASSTEQASQEGERGKEEATEGKILLEFKGKESVPNEASSKLMAEEKAGMISPSESRSNVDEIKEKSGATEPFNEEGQLCVDDCRLHETPAVTDIQKAELKQETVKSSPEHGTEFKAASNVFVEQASGSRTYFDTSSGGQEEESPQTQSYYELSAAAETQLSGDDESVVQKTEKQEEQKVKISAGKMPLEQRSLSLNIIVGSSAGQTVKEEKSRTSSGRLCPISGSFDESEFYPSTPPVESYPHTFPPAVSITPTNTESPKDVPTETEEHLPSDKHTDHLKQSGSLSEMLDLAGTLPCPSLERVEVDHMRRKSVPANVSALVGSSLANLALADQATRPVSRESQLEEVGYCVFSEYSGPMPSPADVPSPGDSPHQRFPSVEGDTEVHLGALEAEGVQKETQDRKEIIPVITPQKHMLEKKESPVKSNLILEKAVTSGIKPDRLRIPLSTSKDRLSEFRLETGLPGDIKIQAIPEVDVEKDPSREASPIPPDSSFTFTPAEIGSKAPPTPTTPKSPEDTSSESQTAGEKARKDDLSEVKAENNSESEKPDNKESELDKENLKPEQKHSEERSDEPEMPSKDMPSGLPRSFEESTDKDKTIQSEHETTTRSEGTDEQEASNTPQVLITKKHTDEKDDQNQLQQRSLKKDLPKLQISSPIIIIPQAQIDEEAEEEDIEIAEEPQEIMEEPEEPDQTEKSQTGEQQKTEQVRLMVDDQMLEEDPKSGAEEWSHSAQNSDEPATDSSHLSPCSDHELPQQMEEGDREDVMGADKIKEDVPIDKVEGKAEDDEGKTEEDNVKKEETREEEGEGVDLGHEMIEKDDEKKGSREEEEKKDTEVGQEVEETSDVPSKTNEAPNDETSMDVSILDTDSGWMDSQGTQSL